MKLLLFKSIMKKNAEETNSYFLFNSLWQGYDRSFQFLPVIEKLDIVVIKIIIFIIGNIILRHYHATPGRDQ